MADHGQDSAIVDSGVVREFHPDEGWGVIDGPGVPGGCWVHFSAIAMDGYRQLLQGQRVAFRAERADQDGFAFRASRVWTGADESVPSPVISASVAYRSVLTLTFDPPPDDLLSKDSPPQSPPPQSPPISTSPTLRPPPPPTEGVDNWWRVNSQ